MKTPDYIILIAMLLSLLSGCDKKEESCPDPKGNTGIIVSNVVFDNCLQIFPYKEIVITTDSSYKKLKDTLDAINNGCQSIVIYPAIDFSKYSLLGKFTSGSGCDIAFDRDVTKDTVNKKIIYTIDVIECGKCEMYSGNMNLITVPKIPDNYSIFFFVK